MKASNLFFLCFSCLLVTTLRAQERIVIQKPGSADVGFDFSGFSAGAGAGHTFFTTLRKNLALPGAFSEAPPSRADLRVLGQARTAGDKLEVTVQVTDRAGRTRRFGKRYRVVANQADTLGRAVADDIYEELTGRDAFLGKRIVFVGLRAGVPGKEIYVAYPDGGGLIQLTRDGSVVMGPSWSPDGGSLLYTSYHRGFPDVYRHDLSPPKRSTISNSPGINSGGALSPDGRKVALVLSKDGKPEVYVKDLASGRSTRLTDTPMSPKSSPGWSPDGRQIVFSSGHQGRPHLYVVDRNGGPLKRITRGGGENLSADWGSNGLIVYTSRRGGLYQVAVLNPRSGESTFVSPADADYEDPAWAPDGHHIVASRTIRGGSSLYLLDREGKTSKSLLNAQGSWYMPDWAP